MLICVVEGAIVISWASSENKGDVSSEEQNEELEEGMSASSFALLP